MWGVIHVPQHICKVQGESGRIGCFLPTMWICGIEVIRLGIKNLYLLIDLPNLRNIFVCFFCLFPGKISYCISGRL